MPRLGLDIGRSTYQRVLIRYNIRKWLAKKRPALTEELANDRLALAHVHVNVDGSASIELFRGKKRVWVFRHLP
jgi:hypothetical protein